MNSLIGYCLFCVVCADSPLVHGSNSTGREKGKILILENQRVLEGDIDLVGDKYRVRRGSGEVLLPASAGLRLCETWDEAFEFMRSRANLGDPEERLRLARWCHLHGLRTHALTEATVALDMRPEYPEAKQLQALLARPGTSATLTSLSKPAPKPKPAEPGVDLSGEALAYYNTKVQPILLNACAHCHTAGRGGAFQIHRANDSGGQRAALQKTLASIIDQISMESPGLSPLLIKAVSVHFPSGPPPLVGRQSPAFKTLERWVYGVPESNPHLRTRSLPAVSELLPTAPQRQLTKKGPAVPSARQIMPPEPVKSTPKTQASDDTPPAPSPAKNAGPNPPTKITTPEFVPSTLPPPTNVNAAPTAPALPLDPFDPVIFNRQMHPNR